jgi:hypothetical protein
MKDRTRCGSDVPLKMRFGFVSKRELNLLKEEARQQRVRNVQDLEVWPAEFEAH